MKHKNLMLALILTADTALSAVAIPAQAAHVLVGINIGVPPPPERVEVIPAARPGYVWAPGYWGWAHRRHVWYSGRWIAARHGYR